ncbi:MAG: flagellar export protein FliJ [Rhodospirillaceae bacterium]
MPGAEIETLIRLRKFEVDEHHRKMAVLLRREETVIRGLDALAEEKEAETTFMKSAGIWEGLTFAAYLEHWELRHQQFIDALKKVRGDIEKVRDELSDAYRRLKTFEITKENRDFEKNREENRLEQIDLDEMGLDLYRRRNDARLL